MPHDEKESTQPQIEETEIQTRQTEEESFKEQYLRLNADWQNYKRRAEKERGEWMTSAQTSVLKKILPVFDELDQVIVHIKLLQRLQVFQKILERHDIVPLLFAFP